jgi:hypothetical protein
MVTGLEMYDALRNATSTLPVGSECSVHAVEAYDLRKLKPSDLASRGYDEKIAKEVSSALLKGDYGPLGKSMGLRLSASHDAPRLFTEGNG